MIGILLGSGFEEIEAITVFDILKRAGADLELVSVTGSLQVSSARNLVVQSDTLIDEVIDKKYDMIVIPGGMGGVRRIVNSPSAKKLLQNARLLNTTIASICAGALVLDKFGLLSDNTRYTCYPGVEQEMTTGKYVDEDVVVDGQFVTSVAPGTADNFAFKLVERLYGKKKMIEVARAWYGRRDENQL